jgi:hypothetical protein
MTNTLAYYKINRNRENQHFILESENTFLHNWHLQYFKKFSLLSCSCLSKIEQHLKTTNTLAYYKLIEIHEWLSVKVLEFECTFLYIRQLQCFKKFSLLSWSWLSKIEVAPENNKHSSLLQINWNTRVIVKVLESECTFLYIGQLQCFFKKTFLNFS